MSGHDAPEGRQREWLAEHYLPDGKTTKQGFTTYAEAKAEADRRNLRDQYSDDYRPSTPYTCPYCDDFHIGHSRSKKKRKKPIPVAKGRRR